ncbi:hypothetical protein [Symmachiella dynata]|uniref:hypothetical protein n=1 Tax=Symmachiella dynata TaxID=2527995 RepID=UPI0030EF56FE
MASSNKSLSADEFETASKILESLIDDYRAIQDFAAQKQRSDLTKKSESILVLQACLDRITLAWLKTFEIVKRYEGLIDELMSPNEPRRSNCGTFATNYHGLLMAILQNFRCKVVLSAYFNDATTSPFDRKQTELQQEYHRKWLEKNHPMSPEERAELDETIWLGDLTDDLSNEQWGLVIEKFAKKPLLEHSEILAGIEMERGRVLKRLRQQEQAAGEQFEYRSEEKEATVQQEPCAPPQDADREEILQENVSTGWQDSADTPPKEFLFGPLTGSKKDLVKWIYANAMDPRTLDKQIKKGTYWGRKNTATSWSVWFSKQEKFNECNLRKRKHESSVSS